jgi:hypothetical protein
MREVVADAFVLGGAAALIAAIWWISAPLGLVAIGLACIGAGLLTTKGGSERS